MLNVKRFVSTGIYMLKDHAPEIMAVVGSVASVGAIGFAIKETPKATKIIEEHKKHIENVHTVVESADGEEEFEYSPDDEKKDLFIIYTKTAGRLLKTYWPVILLESLSIGCTLGGAYKSRQKYSSLLSAAVAMEAIHKQYRQNVVEKYGEEIDKELRHGLKTKTKEYIKKDKDGKETKVKETVKVADNKTDKDISRLFDETSLYYSRDPHANKQFILSVEQWANMRLKQYGHVFLNEVYEKLGFEPTEIGHNVGWVYKDHSADDLKKHNNVIIFNFVDVHGNKATEFEAGFEPSVLIDFNVDGFISKDIKWGKY